MDTTRRRLLQAGLGGGVLLALGGVGIALQPTRQRAPRRPLKALDAASFSVLAAIADRMCPAIGGLPSAWELQVPERVDDTLATLHPAARAEFVQALLLWENGLAGLLLDGRPRPFTACDDAAQDRAIEAWRTSRLAVRRTAFKAVSGLIKGAYWSCPETFAHLGYPGPPRFPEQQGWAG